MKFNNCHGKKRPKIIAKAFKNKALGKEIIFLGELIAE